MPSAEIANLRSDEPVTPSLGEMMTASFFQEAMHRFQQLFQGLPVACFSFDRRGRIYEWNGASERLFRWLHMEVSERDFVDVLHRPEDAGKAREMIVRAFSGESFFGVEWEYRREDGRTVQALCNIFPLRNQDGAVTGALSANIDITERKRAEDALHRVQHDLEARVQGRTAELAELNQTLQAEIIEHKNTEVELQRVLFQSEQLLASITSILIGIDQDGNITTWNTAARQTFGRELTEVQGKPFHQCGIRWEWDVILAAAQQCKTAQKAVRVDDVRYQRDDGKEGWLEITLNPITGYSDGLMGFLLLAADITGRKHLESQLAQAQKLESIGQLAAGIAHEINTPIQYVGDNIRFLQDAFSDLRALLESYAGLVSAVKEGHVSPELVAAVEAVAEKADLDYLMEEIPTAITQSLEGVGRVAHIVRAMKDFSHPGAAEKSAIDLNRSIDSTITVARNEWKYVAEIVTHYDESLPPVPCLPCELNQVILNIIVNAAHAIADVVGNGSQGKGTITISTQALKKHVEIRIQDSGTGIPAEIRSKIFDPFFTTKAVGRGTGQGLAIAHGIIVEKHGGSIACETEVGEGATFIIRLPLA